VRDQRRLRFGPMVAILLGLAVIAVAGCLPVSVTSEGRVVNDLWTTFLVPAIIVAALVWGLTTFAILRYRRRSATAHELPPQISEDRRFEIAWTVIPIITVLVLFWLTVTAVTRIDERTSGGINVAITAFRWQWRFDYPDDGVSIVGLPDSPAEMVVPVGEPVHVTLTSPDVIHSFYVPAFLFKRDATPGRPTEFEFTVEEAGTYAGQCAEFCGVGHAAMTLKVVAVSRPDYEAWLAQNRAGAGASP
jgi:cytochrome c oxidase subunit II